MSVKLIRQSGLPVELENLEKFKEEFRRLFDIAERVCRKDNLRMQKKLARIEKVLQDKYPTVIDIELPNSDESWGALQEKFGNILVSRHKHTNEMILIVSDMEDVAYA